MHQYLSNILRRVEIALTAISGIALIATMFLIVVDVVMRYYFHQPLTWWYDILTNYVMIALFYLVFSDALRRHEHLSIDLLQNRIPKRWARAIFSFIYMIAGPLMIYIGYLGIKSAMASFAQNEVLAGLIAWPTWPTKMIAGIAFLVLGLRGCLMIKNYESN